MDCSGVTTAKNNLQNAFDILVLRGEAIVNAQVQLQQQIAEAYLNKKRQDLSSQQASNFGKLPFKCSQGWEMAAEMVVVLVLILLQ